MQVYGETRKKVAVMLHDVMKIKETYEYDQIIRPLKQMKAIVLRGILSNWKQPIFIDFDTTITKELVFKATNKAHSCSHDVVGCVSDTGDENYGLWKKLKVTIENPADKIKKVFVFADIPIY